ncbi:protein of unknown function [Pseudodesulfovibrio profundus]|uniref:Uncharacterized protein n=1 Tax=Pseudodesulfovibrio profundus TaxID=57320 RepID=A0A2C8FDL8_9BACT|nr:hypothetical protein [Pseudodesulfovibrio profundus]SOB60555.1 protein of unknown function [Pseudodesulfovibrio profundus]
MLDPHPQDLKDSLNKLSLVAHTLRFLAEQNESNDLGAVLKLLEQTLSENILALDTPSKQ